MISSTFDIDDESWMSTGGALSHLAADGNPDGNIRSVEGSSGVWQFRAPAKFLGDLESYYGGTISFDLKQDGSASQFNDEDITLEGGGLTIAIDAGDNPGTDWTSYSVDLELGSGWRVGSVSGRIATEAEIRQVLADLTRFDIRGEFVSGTSGDASNLDNVLVETGPVAPPAGPGGQISSTFDSDIEGWSFIADVREFRHQATGGNPDGHLEVVDFATGEVWYYVASSSYLGDKSAFYGGTLMFDMQQSSLSSQFDQTDVVIEGGGLTIALDHPHPGTDWTSYSHNLSTASDWRIGTEDGTVATEAQIRQVLANITSLRIRGEYVSGNDTGGLDNVVMQAPLNVSTYADNAYTIGVASYATMEEALLLAAPGNFIVSDIANPPRSTAGSLIVDVDNLTVDVAAGFNETFQLTGGARTFALRGDGGADVVGTAGNDTIDGNNGDNRISAVGGDDLARGHGGNDTLVGGNDDDDLFGGTGNDTLRGTGGDDTLYGGSGSDEIAGGIGTDSIIAGGDEDDILGQAGSDTINAGAGNDTVFGGSGADSIRGGGDDDVLYGQGNNDILIGDGGNDTLRGASGADALSGGTGNDSLLGGASADTLDGGSGNDIMAGGSGGDRFLFTVGFGNDTITDFGDDVDKLVLDDTLWIGTLTASDVVDTFGSVFGAASFLLTFDGGEMVRINNISGGAIENDILIV